MGSLKCFSLRESWYHTPKMQWWIVGGRPFPIRTISDRKLQATKPAEPADCSWMRISFFSYFNSLLQLTAPAICQLWGRFFFRFSSARHMRSMNSGIQPAGPMGPELLLVAFDYCFFFSSIYSYSCCHVNYCSSSRRSRANALEIIHRYYIQ